MVESLLSRDPNPLSSRRLSYPVPCLTFSRNGQLAAVSSPDEAMVWESVTASTCRRIHHQEYKSIYALALAADGTLAISYEANKRESTETCIYKNGVRPTSVVTESRVWALSFLSTGTLAMACGGNVSQSWLEILVHNPETQATLRIPITSRRISAISFSSDDRLALEILDKVYVYDLTTGSYQTWGCDQLHISALAFSTNNSKLFIGCFDGSMHCLDLESRTETLVWSFSGIIWSIAPSTNGRLAISAKLDPEIRILELRAESPSPTSDLTLTSTLTERERPILSVVFSRDGKQLVYSSGYDVYVLGPTTGQEICHLRTQWAVDSIAISGDYLAVGNKIGIESAVKVWNQASGQLLKEFKPNSSVDSLAFSPDNRILILVALKGTMTLWDVETWHLQFTLKISKEALNSSVAFSQNGKRLAFFTYSFETGQKLHIWDAERWLCLERFDIQLPLRSYFKHTNQIIIFVDESYIDTTIGRIQLGQIPTFQPSRWHIRGHNLDWLVRDGQRMLWLPPDFRPRSIARYDDLLVMGHKSGKITFFEGNTNESTSELTHENGALRI